MANLKNLAKSGPGNFLSHPRWPRMAAAGERRRMISAAQPRIIEHDNAAGLEGLRTGLPIFENHFVIVVPVDVDHFPLFGADKRKRFGFIRARPQQAGTGKAEMLE